MNRSKIVSYIATNDIHREWKRHKETRTNKSTNSKFNLFFNLNTAAIVMANFSFSFSSCYQFITIYFVLDHHLIYLHWIIRTPTRPSFDLRSPSARTIVRRTTVEYINEKRKMYIQIYNITRRKKQIIFYYTKTLTTKIYFLY